MLSEYLFEAACCGAVILSDVWNGIESFFRPDKEILLARSAADILAVLRDTYHRLAELRAWLQEQATEELQCQNSSAL